MSRATFWLQLVFGALFAADQLAAQVPRWPQFRGPQSRAVAAAGRYPRSLRADENLLWQARLPAGQSSPCIWNDRIFLTGLADADKSGQVDATEWQHATNWFARTENALLAIPPGGHGDVTDTHVAWKQTRGLPYVPSPLYYQGRIYLVKNGGIISCFDAKRGTRLFQGRLGAQGTYHTSPVAGDGKIYVASRRGVVVVVKASDRLQVLSKNDLGEEISATPALVANAIFVRTAEHLYAFGTEANGLVEE